MTARLCAILAILALAPACSHTAPAAMVPDPGAPARLAAADRLADDGCYDCLVEAYSTVERLRAVPGVARDATLRTIRIAGLIAMRERDLGLADGGYLTVARAVAVTPDAPRWATRLLDIVDAVPSAVSGVGRLPASEEALHRSIALRANRQAYSALLAELAPAEPLAAYLRTTLLCVSAESRNLSSDEIFASAGTSPLMAFRRATCHGLDQPGLESLQRADPRFAEISFLLGLAAVGRRDLDAAQPLFETAYDWHPEWPALTQSLGNVALTAEDFDAAARFYDETLAFDPDASDARLGKIRALTYLGRHEDAIAVTDELLAARWYPGDARYWRALNEAQLRRFDDAWVDVEEAAKLIINADVPKLAGIVAYRRQQLDVARVKFEESRWRNPDDCETGFYLGVVLAEQRQWPKTAEIMTATAGCIERSERRLLDQIARIRESGGSLERKARLIERREADIENGRRMLVTSWFNTAVACYSLNRAAEARQYAEKLLNDDQFGTRARDILSRLK